MPCWNDILIEMQNTRKTINGQSLIDFDSVISKYVNKLAETRKRNVIVYYSDWLNPIKGPNIDINDSDLSGFMNCIHGMNKDIGLDLIIHTPGGYPEATEGIVKYLHEIFGDNIEVFVPHMAMSAGTMLACSAKKIWMGKESFLGPIDPQFSGGISGYNIKKEFEEAKKELVEKPETFRNWQILLSKYPPAFYYTVDDSIKLSTKLVEEWLSLYMFKGDENAKQKINDVAAFLNINKGSHGRHLNYKDCVAAGLKIESLEANQMIQDLVLSIYHSMTICGSQTPMCKMICSQNNKRYIANGIISKEIKR